MSVKNLCAAAAGGLLGVYAGFYLILPVTIVAVVWWICRKFLSPEKRRLGMPIAFQAGHALWIAIGLVLVGSLDANSVDPVLVFVGIAWLLVKPGVPPVVYLLIFQALALTINGIALFDANIGTATHKALSVHVGLRVAEIAVLIELWSHLRQRKTDSLIASNEALERSRGAAD